MSFKRKLLIVSFFILNFLTGIQAVTRDEEVKKLMWESGDPAFSVTSAPDKWKSESAVILAQRKYHEYEKAVYLKYLYEKDYYHKRILLLDKASVAECSEFLFPVNDYYGYDSYQYYVGVKIIKPSGKEIIVDLKDAVTMEKEVNSYRKVKYKKLAIPSLEPGDILDYYICLENSIGLIYLFYAFPDVLFSLQDEYPVLNQTLEFKLKRRCFLNIQSMNGAPELQIKDDPKDESTVYYINDTNRDKITEKLWFYKYRSIPTIKFQVYYTNPAGEYDLKYLGEPRIPKKSLTEAEMLKHVQSNIHLSSTKSWEIESYLGKYHKAEKDPIKIVNAAYDFYRYNGYYYSNGDFIGTMGSILKKKKIPFDVLITVPSSISTIDKVVLPGELYYIIRVKTPELIYVCPFGDNTLYNDIEPLLQGTEAYAWNITDRTSEQKLVKVNIPVINAEQNSESNKLKVELDEADFNKVKIHMDVTVKGAAKTAQQKSLMDYQDCKDEECRLLNQKTDLEKIKNKKDKLEMQNKLERTKEENAAEREKIIKSMAEEGFHAKVIAVTNFSLKQTGRWSNNPDLIYSEDIELEGLIKKVGPNYLFEVGKLIGKQLELSEEDKKREYDIYMPYARSFNNEVIIDIPEGYSVEGIEALNITKKSEAGGFTSVAKISDNKIIINTVKVYNHNFEKLEDWKKLEDFLEEAYKFTQQKVLLKKI